MTESYQKEKPPARVNLFLEVTTGTLRKKVELPLRLLIVGDFSGRSSNALLGDKQSIAVNEDNIVRVLPLYGYGFKKLVCDVYDSHIDRFSNHFLPIRMAAYAA